MMTLNFAFKNETTNPTWIPKVGQASAYLKPLKLINKRHDSISFLVQIDVTGL